MGIPDHGPLIVGITWWLTLLCGAFLALRIYAKKSRKQGLWWDDHILIAAWIFLFIEAIITQVGQVLGFGKRLRDVPPENEKILLIGILATSSISCFASTLSKISFGVTLLRLTSGRLRWFVWFCIVTLFILMIPSALNTWIQCTPTEKLWNSNVPGSCWSNQVRVYYGVFNAGWCALADFALALIPWKLIWGLQLQLREKIGVSVAMSLGILAGMCAIIKGYYLKQLADQDFSYNGKDVTIWTVVETATAIIGASIPVLRVFFREFTTRNYYSHGQSHERSRKSVRLSRLNRSHTSSHTVTVQAMGSDKTPAWTTLVPIEDGSGDGASQRGILGDEEHGISRSRSATGVIIHEQDGILQTNTVTVTVFGEPSRQNDKNWPLPPA